MAVRPGEDIALTLFADVHYYYESPESRPRHHRFDKGSYVYLYENAGQRRARLEIANNAGTPDQDAFDGYMDENRIEYTYRHSTLVTLSVDGIGNSLAQDTNQWHLPTFDPRNERKYLYRLHTVDIYFWTKEDALLFIDAVRRVLSTRQLNILEEPTAFPSAHPEAMSPIVQQLENIAISDPSYRDGRTPTSRSSGAPIFSGPPTGTPFIPGPPPTASAPSEKPASYAPMAYNPAAPVAPETIRHREKTPPPEDGAMNPLAAVAAVDQGHLPTGYSQFSTPIVAAISPGGASYFSGPPQAGSKSQYGPGSIAAPPPPAAAQEASYHQNPYSQQAGFLPQYNQHQLQHANYPGSPGIQTPLQSPGLATMPQYCQVPQPTASAPPTVPIGGFSSYTYSRPQVLATASEYNVHQQIYKPTEGEAATKHHALPKDPRGKLEDSAVKIEKGVTSFLKKLEKKYG